MREQQEQPRARPGRCANHPDVAEAGRCDVCGRPLCLPCVIAFRGGVVGPECLTKVLEDAPPQPSPVAARYPRADLLAVAGFGLILLLTILPWSRFGDASGPLAAWTAHWSLVAAAAALFGLLVALRAWFRPGGPSLEAVALGGLALASGTGAVLHYLRPPPLSEPSVTPVLAVVAAALALLGAVAKLGAILRGRRRVR